MIPFQTKEVPVRFDPQGLSDDDLVDRASFTGMTTHEWLERKRDYSSSKLVEA